MYIFIVLKEDYLVAVIFNSLSRICVPLFFMVSGIFLIGEDYDRKKYIKRIVRFILIVINEGLFKNKFILKLSSLSFGVYLIHFLFLFNIKEYINIIEYNPLIYIPY